MKDLTSSAHYFLGIDRPSDYRILYGIVSNEIEDLLLDELCIFAEEGDTDSILQNELARNIRKIG